MVSGVYGNLRIFSASGVIILAGNIFVEFYFFKYDLDHPYLEVSVHKVPFTVLRSSENYSFTMSKLRIFGLRKPCK
jgi:hypothetical protein